MHSVKAILRTDNFLFFLQIAFSLIFSLVIAFISDALSAVPDKAAILSHDASFINEFHDIVRPKTE